VNAPNRNTHLNQSKLNNRLSGNNNIVLSQSMQSLTVNKQSASESFSAMDDCNIENFEGVDEGTRPHETIGKMPQRNTPIKRNELANKNKSVLRKSTGSSPTNLQNKFRTLHNSSRKAITNSRSFHGAS